MEAMNLIIKDLKDEDSIHFLQKILIGQEMHFFTDLKEIRIKGR